MPSLSHKMDSILSPPPLQFWLAFGPPVFCPPTFCPCTAWYVPLQKVQVWNIHTRDNPRPPLLGNPVSASEWTTSTRTNCTEFKTHLLGLLQTVTNTHGHLGQRFAFDAPTFRMIWLMRSVLPHLSPVSEKVYNKPYWSSVRGKCMWKNKST